MIPQAALKQNDDTFPVAEDLRQKINGGIFSTFNALPMHSTIDGWFDQGLFCVHECGKIAFWDDTLQEAERTSMTAMLPEYVSERITKCEPLVAAFAWHRENVLGGLVAYVLCLVAAPEAVQREGVLQKTAGLREVLSDRALVVQQLLGVPPARSLSSRDSRVLMAEKAVLSCTAFQKQEDCRLWTRCWRGMQPKQIQSVEALSVTGLSESLDEPGQCPWRHNFLQCGNCCSYALRKSIFFFKESWSGLILYLNDPGKRSLSFCR